MSPQGRRDFGGAIDARSDSPAPEGESGRVSLYGDAIRALRQVILLDERVRNSAIDLARLSQEVADLRDRGEPARRHAGRGPGACSRGRPAPRLTPAAGSFRSDGL